MRNYSVAGLCSSAAIALAACAAAPSTPEAEAGPAGAAGTPHWETVWFDDFDGDSLDRERWAPEESCWGGGNNERQCYTDRPANIQVEDGILRLIARKETYTGPLRADQHGSEEREQPYTSGKIRTRGLADWTYGRFSARMKLPEGQGTWPAFWMMPSASIYGRWPLSGEIDIMEAVNLGTPCEDCPTGIENRTSGAAHFGDVPPDNTYLFLKIPGETPESPADEWRVYTLEWGAGEMQWLVDGEVFMRLDADDWYTGSANADGRPYAPFDQPFYLMLNLAAGGNLPEKSNEAGFDPDSFPAELLVDWVKVEQCAGDLETGLSCFDRQAWAGTPKGPWEVQAR
ncbi:glycoside hydrolase family 16 protein [Henriciella mobilis]|uniref:glycoside hydrolase family 16 protein n=1 Tax=Henriciella mobilis TaxID=2305467 RepID=UPI000E6686A1|nr:glycoside hydrolase family 16 protein [Henriciella mobilis]RIJ17201.1 glycoside hydrolase family 16 protein [Henriciella mobilis]RIJ22451.1 glycoside hydrolase family 16 protein [Henriciella mobilis]